MHCEVVISGTPVAPIISINNCGMVNVAPIIFNWFTELEQTLDRGN
jgi:hypothetical protein